MIAYWKGIVEEIHFGGYVEGIPIFLPIFPKNVIYGLKTTLEVLGPEKLLKIVNYQNCQKIVLSQLEKVGGH
jgi:hypothetical protein